jgi:hypothetical protein
MTIFEKLVSIQSELKAPKSQFNKFGNYHYRNQEDILEAVKPLLKKYQAVLTISDQIVVFEGRHYVEATAKLTDIESGSVVSTSAFAREDADKKGMDLSQLTGATSSYARKYALNGLFLIDDTKDADATNTHTSNVVPTAPKIAPQPVEAPKVVKVPLEVVSPIADEVNKHMESYDPFIFDGELPKAPENPTCDECHTKVSDKVRDYSTKVWGKALCFKCQERAREGQ